MNRYKEILNKLYSYYPFYLFAIASFILTREYYFSPGVPLGNDYLGWVARIQQFSENNEMFSIWSDWGFGLVQLFSAHIPLSLVNSVVNNPSLVLSITITIVLFITFSSMYFLAKYLSKSTLAAVLAAIVFACNQYAFSRFASGHLPFSIGYALLPLIMLFYLYILDKRSKSNAIFLLLIFWITIAFTRLDIILYSVPLLVILTIGKYCTLRSKEAIFDLTKYLVIVGTLMFAGLLSLMAVQLLPMIMGAKPAYVSLDISVPIRELQWWSLSFYQSMLGFARELGVLFSQGDILWYSHPFLKEWQYNASMSVLPFLAICTLLIKRSWLTVSLLFLIIISVFLAKGPNEPLSDIYLWFYRNIPGFGVLKTPNRWIMLVYLSYSILFSFLIAFLVHEFRLEKINNHMRNLILFIRRNRMGFMINTLNWITIRLSKVDKIFLDKISIFSKYCILMVIIGATSYSLYIASWNIFLHGFQTWNPPTEEIAPHLWLAEQKGTFRVATIPYFQEFMKTEEGVPMHDLGFSSFLWSGHPVLGIGNWKTGPAYSFVNYTHGLMIDGKTSDFGKLLGRYNVRYIVVQGYEPTHLQSIPAGLEKEFQSIFISQQEGLNLVWQNNKTKVYENLYWQEKIQANNDFGIITGGKDILIKRESIRDTVPIASKDLVFLRDLEYNELLHLISLGENLPELVIYQTDVSELRFLMSNHTIEIKPTNFPQASNPWYVSPHFDVEENSWFSNSTFEKSGIPTYSPILLSSHSEAKTATSFEVSNEGDYDVWIRLRFGKDVGRVNISVDDKNISSVFPISKEEDTFKWVNVGTTPLEKGVHEFGVHNVPELSMPAKTTVIFHPYFVGDTDIDKIILVPVAEEQQINSDLRKILSRVDASYLSEAGSVKESVYGDPNPKEYDSWASYQELWKAKEKLSTSVTLLPTNVGSGPQEDTITLAKVEYSNDSNQRRQKALMGIKFVESGIGKPFSIEDNDFFYFYYAGSGNLTAQWLYVYTGKDDFAGFKLNNADTRLKKYVFDPNKPYEQKGDVDWSNITEMVIQTGYVAEEGQISFSGFKTLKVKDYRSAKDTLILTHSQSPINVTLAGIERKDEDVNLEFTVDDKVVGSESLSSFRSQGSRKQITQLWEEVGNSKVSDFDITLFGLPSEFGVGQSIKVEQPSVYATIAEINFPEFINMANHSGVEFPFVIDDPDGKLENVALVFYIRDEQTWARFNLDINSQKQLLQFKKPHNFAGKVEWQFVNKVKLQIQPKGWRGTVTIGSIDLVDRVLRDTSTALEKQLGIYPPGSYYVGVDTDPTSLLNFISIREGLPSISNAEQPVVSNITRVSPDRYTVSVNAKQAYMLSLMETYHPLWRAYVNGTEIEPIVLESFVNGFWIEDYLSKEIEIVFIGQKFVSIGGAITIITLAILLILLIQIKTNLFNQYQIKFQRIFKKISSF